VTHERDVDLVPRVAAGDEQAAEHLLSKYWRVAERRARRILDDADAAEDAAATVFADLAAGKWGGRWGAPDPDGEYAGCNGEIWNYVSQRAAWIAYRLLARRRDDRFNPIVDDDDDEQHHLVVTDSRPNPEQLALRSERRRRLRLAIAALSPKDRVILKLRGLDEHTIPAIGRLLACSAAAIHDRLRGIRDHLRQHVGDVFDLPKPGARVRRLHGRHVTAARRAAIATDPARLEGLRAYTARLQALRASGVSYRDAQRAARGPRLKQAKRTRSLPC
jgi:RNA polymerase sigma factor (sigma-70 family)